MNKGSYGYLRKKRKFSLMKSILLLTAVLLIYLAALRHFGTNRNVFSILAAVGALPAGRSIVDTVMCFRAGSASERAQEAVSDIPGFSEINSGFDFYLTAYEHFFSLSHAAVKKHELLALTESEKTDCSLCEKHISQMLEQNGLSGYRVRVLDSLEDYRKELTRLSEGELQEKDPDRDTDSDEKGENEILDDREQDRKVMDLLCAISL